MKLICNFCGKYFTKPGSLATHIHHKHYEALGITEEEHTIWKRRFGDANRGRVWSKEAIKKRADSNRGKKRSSETGRKISEALKGEKFSDEFRQMRSQAQKGKKPSKSTRIKIGEGNGIAWAKNPQRRIKQSSFLKELWANPNSGYNNKTGYGKRKLASDGHKCDSSFELIFEEWLISCELKHEPHPRISNTNGRRADQLVNGYYIEIDGMYRSDEFWEEKYKDTDIKPIIVKAKNLPECLNTHLLSILREEED